MGSNHMVARLPPWPRQPLRWGTLGPPAVHPPTTSSSCITQLVFLSHTRVLAVLLRDFDLFVQPISAAEIWGICSPVCDSSMYPSRILFSKVYLEYFAAVGDLLSEYACLFYVDIISFDACLVL